MTKKRSTSVAHGVVLTIGATVFSRLLAVLANLAVIKILSPTELGVFLGVQAMVFIGGGFCDLGLSHGYRQMASRDHSLRGVLLGPTLSIQLVTALLYFIGLATYLAHSDNLTAGTILVAIGALSSQWPAALGIDLYIVRKFRKAGFLSFISIAGIVLGVLLALNSSEKFFALALGYALGMIGHSLCALLFVDRNALRLKFTPKLFTLAKVSAPFLASIIVSRFGMFFGVSYLLAFQSSYAAGIVGFPLKLYQITLLLSTATTSVTLPHFHRLAQKINKKDLAVALEKLIGPLWLVMGCVAGVCILIPDTIVATVGGSQYAESAILLPIFALALLLKGLAIPAGNILESRSLQWLRVAVQSVSSTIIVLSIILLVPKYGLIMVAYAMLAADACSFILLWGINAIGMAHILPWRKHILGSVTFGTALGASWAAPLNNVLTALLFLGSYTVLAASLKVYSPRTLVHQVIGMK